MERMSVEGRVGLNIYGLTTGSIGSGVALNIPGVTVLPAASGVDVTVPKVVLHSDGAGLKRNMFLHMFAVDQCNVYHRM